MLLQNGKLGVINRITACKPCKIVLLRYVDNAFTRIQQQKVLNQLESIWRRKMKMIKSLKVMTSVAKKKELGLDNVEKRLFMGDIVKDFK